MCGIAVYIGPHEIDASAVIQSLAHRGPDSNGVWSERLKGSFVTLIHTRLAIRDLSPLSNQPMVLRRVSEQDWSTRGGAAENVDYVIAYNGEVYNVDELREELKLKGHSFDSQGDTEVLLRGFAQWGDGIFTKLDGIFALAILDKRRERLIVARDHLGIKPLYYARTTCGGLVIASEVRTIIQTGRCSRSVDTEAVWDYLRFGSFQEPATIFEQVRAFTPGTITCVRLGERQLCARQYWRASDFVRSNREAYDPVRHRKLLSEMVRQQLAADVGVGVFLSGGIDSTVLLELAVASGVAGQIIAFTVAGELTADNEDLVAAKTASNLGVRHLVVRPTQADKVLWVNDALHAMDQPSCDGINTYVVSRASRAAGLVVALGGTGADELHGAYGHAKSLSRVHAAAYLAPWLFKSAGRIGTRLFRATQISPLGERALGLLAECDRPWRLVQEKRRFFTKGQIATMWPTQGGRINRWQFPVGEDNIAAFAASEQITIGELKGYLLNTLLKDADWASMANSQELRVPFLSRRYVEFVLGIPAELKWRKGTLNKPLLAGLISDRNRDLAHMPKRGFAMNYTDLLVGPFRQNLAEACDHLRKELAFKLEADDLVKWLKSDLSTKVSNRVWALMTLGRYLAEWRII